MVVTVDLLTDNGEVTESVSFSYDMDKYDLRIDGEINKFGGPSGNVEFVDKSEKLKIVSDEKNT